MDFWNYYISKFLYLPYPVSLKSISFLKSQQFIPIESNLLLKMFPVVSILLSSFAYASAFTPSRVTPRSNGLKMAFETEIGAQVSVAWWIVCTLYSWPITLTAHTLLYWSQLPIQLYSTLEVLLVALYSKLHTVVLLNYRCPFYPVSLFPCYFSNRTVPVGTSWFLRSPRNTEGGW